MFMVFGCKTGMERFHYDFGAIFDYDATIHRDATAGSSVSSATSSPTSPSQPRPSVSSDNASSDQSTERKPTLRDIFYPSGFFTFSRLRSFLGGKKHSESSGKSSAPSNVQAAPDLLEKYKTSLKKQNFANAEMLREKIVLLIVNHVDAKAEDVKLFGKKLLKDKKFLESIAIFDAAAILFSKLKNPKEDLDGMGRCVCGMREANIAMIGDDVKTKVIVEKHVIPLMRKWLRQMQNTSQVSVKWRCLKVSWVLHYIEYSEYLVNEWLHRESTLSNAITGMRKVFGSDVSRDHGRLFGTLLENHGYLCHGFWPCGHYSRFMRAASYYKQSIDAKIAATDYSDEEERQKDIARSEHNMKLALQTAKIMM